MDKELNKTAKQIARLVDGEVVGDGRIALRRLAGTQHAQKGDLTFVTSEKYVKFLHETHAAAAIVGLGVQCEGLTLIRVAHPELAVGLVMELVAPDPPVIPRQTDAKAAVASSARIGKETAIGPFAVVEEDAVIGDRTILYPGVYVGHGTRIGVDCVLYPNVTVRERIVIGDRVVIHSSTVIGSDGFGYAPVDGKHEKIPQRGTVRIDDDVEIGSNVSVDRARFDKTHIQRGVKIDNLVQIGHNVVIEEDSIILAMSGIAGSSILGKGSTMAVQSGVLGHVTVGPGSIIAARGGLIKDVPAGSMVGGFPAWDLGGYKKSMAAVRRLPGLVERVRRLEKRLQEREREGTEPTDDR